MKIIQQAAVYINDTDDGYKKIEQCGRVCYKSEDKISDGSAIKFCRAMLRNKHLAMLEHATVYAVIPMYVANTIDKWINRIKTKACTDNIAPYINITKLGQKNIISFSFRIVAAAIDRLIEDDEHKSFTCVYDFFKKVTDMYTDLFNDETMGEKFDTIFKTRTSDHKYNISIFTKNEFVNFVKTTYPETIANKLFEKHLMHTIIFTTNRGVTHELVRHRPASFAQESTRYCNYSKGQFGKEITVIEPCYFTDNKTMMDLWKDKVYQSEKAYFDMIAAGATAQEARGLLPHDIKADIVITASETEWQHIINLRYYGTTGAPHPQAREAVGKALPLLQKNTDNRVK